MNTIVDPDWFAALMPFVTIWLIAPLVTYAWSRIRRKIS